jgi:hypothetical protein
MTSIGNGDFPEMTPSEAVEVVEGIKREKAQTTAGLGKVMGLTNTGTGFFYGKLAALSKHYGLIDRQKTSITLTPLGKRIAYRLSEEDRGAAISEMVKRVPLLRDLFQALGPEFSDLDFPEKLRSITNADPEEIESKGPRVEKLYRDAIPYLANQRPAQTVGPQSGLRNEPAFRAVPGGPGTSGDAGTLAAGLTHEPGYRTFHSDGVVLKIKKDPEALEEARAVIAAWILREQKKTVERDERPTQRTRDTPEVATN